MNTNRNIFLLIAIIVLTIGFLYYLFFVNKTSTTFLKEKKLIQEPVTTYPALDENLTKVVNSPNPKKTAEKLDLAVLGDGVATVIILKDADFAFTDTLGTQVSRYGNAIEATVKFSKLKTLGGNKMIKSIRAFPKSILTRPTTAPATRSATLSPIPRTTSSSTTLQ